MPLVEAVRGHVFAASGCRPTTPRAGARCRLYAHRATMDLVRDDRPFCSTDPPAAAYFYSSNQRGKHPEEHLASWAGPMQADAYAGYDRLYDAGRRPGPIVEVACWAMRGASSSAWRDPTRHRSPSRRWPGSIRCLSSIATSGLPPEERREVRQERSRSRVEALGAWRREQHARLSPNNQVAEAIAYSLNAWGRRPDA
jgi:transposase